MVSATVLAALFVRSSLAGHWRVDGAVVEDPVSGGRVPTLGSPIVTSRPASSLSAYKPSLPTWEDPPTMISRIRFDRELAQAIRVRGLTMTEVARRANLSMATVSAALKGRPVNMTTALRLTRTVTAAPVVPELERWARDPASSATGASHD